MTYQQINEYKILQPEGGTQHVDIYQVYDHRLERTAALRLLPQELLLDKSVHEKFEREIKTYAQLESSNIMPVYDYGIVDGRPYVVTKRLTGGTAQDHIEKHGGLPASLLAYLLNRIAKAFDDLSSLGIHIDSIPTDTVAFDENGDVFLTDINVASLLAEARDEPAEKPLAFDALTQFISLCLGKGGRPQNDPPSGLENPDKLSALLRRAALSADEGGYASAMALADDFAQIAGPEALKEGHALSARWASDFSIEQIPGDAKAKDKNSRKKTGFLLPGILGIPAFIVLAYFVVAWMRGGTPPQTPLPDSDYEVFREDFDDLSGFTNTFPDNFRIEDGYLYWHVTQDTSEEQFIYRDIPELNGNYRITVAGNVTRHKGNNHIGIGIGETYGAGPHISFGFYGDTGYLIGARGGLTGFVGTNCGGDYAFLCIDRLTHYTAVLTVIDGYVTLEVEGVGALLNGHTTYQGPFNTLWIGNDGGHNWPYAEGSLDYILIEELPATQPAVLTDFLIYEEMFESEEGLTITTPAQLYVEGGKLFWDMTQSLADDQFAYRTIPAFTGNFRMTVTGEFSGHAGNHHVNIGIGPGYGNGVSMAWGNYDSEYYVSSRVSPVIPIIVSQDTTFTAVLTFIDGQIELTVGDITHTGAVTYEGDFDTLWIGNVGNNTGDIYCSGMIESIVIEKIPDPVVLFEDQFDSTELDRGVWSLDSESSEYCGDASVTMSDGTVQISSGTAHSANCGIRSIPLWTISEGITYLLEARMKDETADGGGAVLCFLEGVPSASRSMISMGYRTNEPTIHTLIEGIGGANDYTEVQLSTDPREWHIYQILIEPHSVTYLIDGEVIESYATTIPRGKTYQLNLIRNSYQVNQTMEVDYIRLTQTSIPPAP